MMQQRLIFDPTKAHHSIESSIFGFAQVNQSLWRKTFPFSILPKNMLSAEQKNPQFYSQCLKQCLFDRLGCTFIQYIAPSLYLAPDE